MAKRNAKTEIPADKNDAIAADDADEFADLEALLEGDGGDEEINIDEPESGDESEAEAAGTEPSEEEIAEAAAGAELDETREKLYEEAPVEEPEVELADAPDEEKAKKKAKTKTPPKPKFDAESVLPTLEMTIEGETPKFEGLAKKVREKVNNIAHNLTTGAKLSNYTVIGLKALFDQGTVTSKELLETMRERYSEGTARAQSNQIMNVLPAMKIAIKEGSTLKLNPALKEEIGEQLKKALG